jgi:hypothetical protein
VVIDSEVSMVTLMHTVDAEEVGGGGVGRDGTFDTANECRVVIV